ncbi:type VI secretion system baseplate subunit TssK [Oxalobacteraceae bacterium A2-2]
MGIPSRLLWGEGEFLHPQHFQQQDRYHEAHLLQLGRTLQPFLWGVRGIEWDREALALNKLRLLSLRAIFPDGEMVDAPASAPAPPALDLAAIAPATQEFICYAALPALAASGNVADTGARYRVRRCPCSDQHGTAADTDIASLQPVLRLVSDQETLGGYDHLPLARLRRTVSGAFEPDPAFIPPALAIDGAPRLRQLLDLLLDALQAKIHALQGHMREPSRNVIEFRSGDVSSFWLLHTASTAAAGLAHLARHGALHPERLYAAMLALAGALMTYSKHYTLAHLPPYRHEDLGGCFGELDRIIRDLLDTVISTRYFAIALNEDKPGYHGGKLDSGRIGPHTALYLAVGASLPAHELVEVAPLRIKAGAPDDVAQCVLSAMPGVRLTHAPQVPAAIPVRPETCYFALENKGTLYERMLKAQSICIYVPAGIPDLRLELIAVAP